MNADHAVRTLHEDLRRLEERRADAIRMMGQQAYDATVLTTKWALSLLRKRK